jgi:hypothetical protein
VLTSSRASVLMIVCLGLACCAPRPPDGIPNGAKAEWSLKGDWTWTWERRLNSGCVAWMASDRWASVQLVVDSQCEGQRGEGYLDGSGVTYSSFNDHLIFRGYWLWTQEEYSDLMVFDDDGMIIDILPCPHVLSPEQIAVLRVTAQEAHDQATTDPEKRILARVDERLAVTNGAALSSGQAGCSDLPSDWHNVPSQSQDIWSSRKQK